MDKVPKKYIQSKEYHKTMENRLKKLIPLLNKLKITYSIGFGTLLGKVRHNNFIPWDDDIDLLVKDISDEKQKELIDELKKNNIRSRKTFFGVKTFSDNPYIDIMYYDNKWGGGSMKGEWSNPAFKSALVSSTLRGIPIKMPNKKDTKDYLERTYSKNYMKEAVVYNHKNKKKLRIKL